MRTFYYNLYNSTQSNKESIFFFISCPFLPLLVVDMVLDGIVRVSGLYQCRLAPMEKKVQNFERLE